MPTLGRNATDTYHRTVKRLYAQLVPDSDDRARSLEIWQQWGEHSKGCDDLFTLLWYPAAPNFAALCIMQMLAPVARLCPYATKWYRGEDCHLSAAARHLHLRKLPEDLQTFAVSLVKLGQSLALAEYKKTRPSIAYAYNGLLLEAAALPLRDPDLAARYLLSIDDTGSCDYDFLEADLDDEWKSAVDQRLQCGIARARGLEKRQALEGYAEIIDTSLWRKKLPYGDLVLARQMEFLLEQTEQRRVFLSVGAVTALFKRWRHDIERRALLSLLIRRHLLESTPSYLGGRDQRALRGMMREFASDRALVERIRQLLEDHRSETAKSMRASSERIGQKLALMHQMSAAY